MELHSKKKKLVPLSSPASASLSVDLKPKKGFVELNTVFLKLVGLDTLWYSQRRSVIATERNKPEQSAAQMHLTNWTLNKSQCSRMYAIASVCKLKIRQN